jgi:hypothetical protein
MVLYIYILIIKYIKYTLIIFLQKKLQKYDGIKNDEKKTISKSFFKNKKIKNFFF